MNFFDHAGSSAPIDLQVPDTFHRLKRTLLLFCSILIVLGLAQGAETRELKLTMVDVSLHIELIRSLLWLAAVYYLIGFVMEVRIVRLINSEAMLGAGMKSVENAFAKIGRRIEEAQSTIDAAVTRTTDQLKPIQDAITPHNPLSVVISELAATKNILVDPSTVTRLSAMEHRLGEAIMEQQEQGRTIQHLATGMSNAVDEYVKRRAEMVDLLQRLERDFGKLSRRIHGDRRLSFWAWEIGGATSAFFIATVINGSHLLRNASDAILTFFGALHIV
jgi:hypothetical protein